MALQIRKQKHVHKTFNTCSSLSTPYFTFDNEQASSLAAFTVNHKDSIPSTPTWGLPSFLSNGCQRHPSQGWSGKIKYLHLDLKSRKKACSCMLSWHLVNTWDISYHTVDTVKCNWIRLQHTSTRAKPTNNWFIYMTKKMCASCDNLVEKQGCPVQLLHTQFCTTSNILFEGKSEDLSNTKTQIFNGIVTSPRSWIE